MLRTLSYFIFFYLYLFKITPRYFRIKKLKKLGDKEAHINTIRKTSHQWGKALLSRAKVSLNVIGSENIPDGPVLFVSNHQSNFDIPIFFAALDKQIGFIAKKELNKFPLFNKWIQVIESVFIDRDDARQSLKAFQEGIELLKNGYSLVIFPEGTRSKDGIIQEFKKGSLRLAVKSNVPVVPITIVGSYKLFEEKKQISTGKVDFIIHEPILTEKLSKEDANNLAERVHDIIEKPLN